MPSTTGFQLLAGRIPGEVIGEALQTSASSGTSALVELAVQTLVVPLVNGRTYRIPACGVAGSTVNSDTGVVRIRQDNVAGAQVAQFALHDLQTTLDVNYMMEGRYTPIATANKTFVVTLQRIGGSGSLSIQGSSIRPGILACYYHSG